MCISCDRPLPSLHEGTERCGHCGTAYRLGRDQEQNIVVLISPDLDHFLVEAIQRWIGLPGFQRQTTFQGIRYFSIYPDDRVSLDSNVLVIGRATCLVQYEVQQLTFLRLHCDLPPNITAALEQAKVKLYRISEKAAKTATSPLLEAVLDFGRRSQAFNRRLGENNLIARALLWHRQLPTHQ